MLPLKLFIAGLVASAFGLAMFALTCASLDTNVNVLDLALRNPTSVLTNAANLPVNSNDDLAMEDGVTSTVTGTITSTLTLTGTNKIIDAITKYFSGTLTNTVTVSDFVGLRDDGWGFGEIFKLYELAKESGKTPDEIKAMRDDGMGWGEIAKALGLSPGNKGNNLGAAISGRGDEAQTTHSPNNDNSHGNPHGSPPGKSESGPPGKGKGKGK